MDNVERKGEGRRKKKKKTRFQKKKRHQQKRVEGGHRRSVARVRKNQKKRGEKKEKEKRGGFESHSKSNLFFQKKAKSQRRLGGGTIYNDNKRKTKNENSLTTQVLFLGAVIDSSDSLAASRSFWSITRRILLMGRSLGSFFVHIVYFSWRESRSSSNRSRSLICGGQTGSPPFSM